MIMSARAALALLAVTLPIAAHTQTPDGKPVSADAPAPVILESGLVGHWAGTLSYRDYQSDKMVDLPMRTNIVALADEATILNIATFDDGPARGNVLITTALLFNSKAGTVENVALERGRPIDHYTDKAKVVSYTDATHWTISYQHVGTDNKHPAVIRTTETRDGPFFSSQEDVRAPDGTNADWKMRNKTVLKSEDIKPAVTDR